MFASALLVMAMAAQPIKVAVTRLNFVDASDGRVDFYTEHFADRLAEQGIEVSSPREVTTLLGLERQRQLMGCTEQSSCLAEIAAALGVDGVVVGDLARIGSTFQMNLKVLDASNGKRLATSSSSAKSEEELLANISNAAQTMAQQLAKALGRPLSDKPAVVVEKPAIIATPVVEQKAAGGSRRFWWIPAVVGVLAGAFGTIELVRSENARLTLLSDDPFIVSLNQSTGAQTFADGVRDRTLGFVGVGVGVAALATSAALLIFGSDAPVVPTAMIDQGAAGLAVQGHF
jgi:TolB-like protein